MAFLQKKKILRGVEETSSVGHELKGTDFVIPDIREALMSLDPANEDILAKFLPGTQGLELRNGAQQTKRKNLFKECDCFKKKKKK
jgi:hypothetical protein